MLEIDESLQQTEPDCREGSESKPFLLRHPARADLDVLVALANTPAMTKKPLQQLAAGFRQGGGPPGS